MRFTLLRVRPSCRFSWAVIIFTLLAFTFILYLDTNISPVRTVKFESIALSVPKYLINTTTCKIPDLDPMNEDVVPYVFKEKYVTCTDKPFLTYIEKDEFGDVKLKINHSASSLYTSLSIKCCYSLVLRSEGDSTVRHSKCKSFQDEVTLDYEHVRVICRNIFGGVYQNVHTTIISKNIPKSNRKAKIKIFMLGIDSISSLNLQRTMPKVHRFLEDNFIGFRGYNKIEDNTFPNLMAILSGRSMDTLEPSCSTYEAFDDCDIIWKSFRESGFVTAYGEDEPFLNTFNYYKKGFLEPPTSVYLRPYFLSSYFLPTIYQHRMGVCTGPENTGERMLNAAKDFLHTFRNESTFAFYWMNSFSHDNVNYPSTMEDKLMAYFNDSVIRQTLDDSIFVMFSDHGFRFGDIRFTYSGWLEERLPYLYFKFPKTFQKSHPDLIENFKFNAKNRLTVPYDFHMTLQQLLKMVNDSYTIKPSLGCPACNKSLFQVLDEKRTCEEAAVPQHYCTCDGYTRISAHNDVVTGVAQYVVDQINNVFNKYDEGFKCVLYKLRSVETVGRHRFIKNKTEMNDYLILIQTYPYAMFEATVRQTGRYELLGPISRLNKYAAYSNCVHNDVLRKYCFCDSWTTTVLSYICYIFKCPVY